MTKNYARDFNDRILNEKYEQELYNNQKIRKQIKQMRDNVIFYTIASAWLFMIIFFPKFTIAGMALFWFLNYKMDYFQNKSYIYYTGFMFIVAAVYSLSIVLFNSMFHLFTPEAAVVIVLTVIAFIAYFITAVVCALKYLFFVVPSMAWMSALFQRYNLGKLRIASDEKLCRLESEIMERRRKTEESRLEEMMEEKKEEQRDF